MVEIVKEICGQNTSIDPLTFDLTTIKAAPIMLQADHTGVRVKLTAKLSNIQIPMQIDFSFANVITPGPILMQYPNPIGNNVTSIKGYPPETSIAEKLETLVSWGIDNARYKDFYDIWVLSQECAFNGATLTQAIKATFNNRKTTVPTMLPPSLSQDFAEKQQVQWTAFLRKFGGESSEINDFTQILAQLREFIVPVLQAAVNNESLDKTWSRQQGWT